MKTLVIYYSAEGHTKRIAEEIAKNLQADSFEITPSKTYTPDDLNWMDNNSRCTKEHDNPSLRDIELDNETVPNWEEYDRIIIGYPIWWGIAAWPTNSFVKKQDLTGKTIIPFCTSHSSGLGTSDEELKNDANSGDWQKGHRFYQDDNSDTIEAWTKSLSS